MSTDDAGSDFNRREFICATAAGFAIAATSGAMQAAPPAADAPANTVVSNAKRDESFAPITIPPWVYGITRMSFLGPDSVADAARIGVQVVHGNAVWPYYPLRKDGGRLPAAEHEALTKFSEATHKHGLRLVLGLPPFPSVETMKAHPDWRVAPDASGAELAVVPDAGNLGTRIGCNLGPWGDYLIELCGELLVDYKLDGFSFDGNYHPPICYCAACRAAYQKERSRAIPPKIDLDSMAYREYLVWRGEKLEGHYRRLQARLKGLNRDAVVMTWSTNAGRYGHLLTSPRVMSTRMNLLIDLPMQEWWLDETNVGASVAPSFGAEYLSAVAGYRPVGCEAYLMSRGNPYSGDSFPAHERLARSLLTLTHNSTTAHSIGWTGGADGAAPVFAATREREPWLTHCRPLPWAALLVSESTRQFYAYRDIAERFLPHVFGAYRVALEEHLPLSLVNDWDLTAENLARYKVVVLPNAASISNAGVDALIRYVNKGGGLVATCETSLCDKWGRPRRDFALADLFGVSYRGRPQATKADAAAQQTNPYFPIDLDERYWQQRVGASTLTWTPHAITDDAALAKLVPKRTARFKGPQVLVAPHEKTDRAEIIGQLIPDNAAGQPVAEAASPAIVARQFGKGRVVYFAAALDAAQWSYAYPYQRILLARAIAWAAGGSPPIEVRAPRCVEATFYRRQQPGKSPQLVIHLFNNVNTTAHHGNPASDVPLREETVPIHGIEISLPMQTGAGYHVEPGNRSVTSAADARTGRTTLKLPPLELHMMVVAEPWT